MNAKPIREWTNDELRLWIAARLGWLFVAEVTDPTDGHLFLWGSPPDNIHVKHVLPDWTADLNAAAELLKAMPDHILIWHTYYESWAIQEVILIDTERDFQTRTVSDNPARAICEAYVLSQQEADHE